MIPFYFAAALVSSIASAPRAAAVNGSGLGGSPGGVQPLAPSAAPSYWIDYDADNLTQGSGTVSAVADNGPASAPLAASGSAKPAYLASYLNGHAGVSCDGSTSWLSSAASPNPSSSQMTLYFVGEATSTANSKFLLETTTNASTSNGLVLYNSDTQGTNQISGFMGVTSTAFNSATVWTGTRASTPQIYVLTYDRTRSCSSCLNGTEQVHVRIGRLLESGVLEYQQTQTGAFAAGTINVCDRSGPAASLFYQAKWTRILLYNSLHTPATQNGVVEYLAARYGLYSTKPTRQVVVTGDSISSTGNISTDYESWTDFLAYGGSFNATQFTNWSFGGRTLADMSAHTTDEIAASYRPGVEDDLFVWGGTNDAAVSTSLTPSQLFTNSLLPIIQAAQSAGYSHIGIIPMLYRNGAFAGGVTAGSFATFCTAYNSLVASNAATYGYTVVSIDGGTGNLTGPTAYSNTTYFNTDQIHPNPTSKQNIEAVNVAALLNVWN